MKSHWAFHGAEGTRQQRHTLARAPWWALRSYIDKKLQGAEGEGIVIIHGHHHLST